MAELFKIKQKNQYEGFLHKIQMKKMKELWDNKEDEAWEIGFMKSLIKN